MAENQQRRQFLQTSLAAGALTLASSQVSEGFIGRAIPSATDANPAARPGRVRWHGDFAAACTAARRSGKPVFLFHMLGRLDQRFC